MKSIKVINVQHIFVGMLELNMNLSINNIILETQTIQFHPKDQKVVSYNDIIEVNWGMSKTKQTVGFLSISLVSKEENSLLPENNILIIIEQLLIPTLLEAFRDLSLFPKGIFDEKKIMSTIEAFTKKDAGNKEDLPDQNQSTIESNYHGNETSIKRRKMESYNQLDNQSSIEQETAPKRKSSHIEEYTSNKSPKLSLVTSTADASNKESFDHDENRQQLVRVFGEDLQVFGFSSNKRNKRYCSGAILELKFICNEILINDIINCLKSKSEDKEKKLVALLQNDSICLNYFKICKKFDQEKDKISDKINGDGHCFLRTAHHIAKTFLKCSTSHGQCDQYKVFIEENELSHKALYDDVVTMTDIGLWGKTFKKYIDDEKFWQFYEMFNPELEIFKNAFNRHLDYIFYQSTSHIENLDYMDVQHFHLIRPIICDFYEFLQSDFHFTVFKKIEEDDLLTPIDISKSAFISEIPKFAYSKDTLNIKTTIGIYSLCLSTTNSSIVDQIQVQRRLDMDFPNKEGYSYDCCLNYQQLMTTLNPIFYVWHQIGGGKEGVFNENQKNFENRKRNHITIFPYPDSYEYVNVPLTIETKTVSDTGRLPRSCTYIQKIDNFIYRYKDFNDAYTLSSEQDDLNMIIKDIALKMIQKWN